MEAKLKTKEIGRISRKRQFRVYKQIELTRRLSKTLEQGPERERERETDISTNGEISQDDFQKRAERERQRGKESEEERKREKQTKRETDYCFLGIELCLFVL